MEIRVVDALGARVISREGLRAALDDPDSLVWIDIPVCDEAARSLLVHDLGFHLVAVREAATRQRMPKMHRYPDHVFVVLHVPMLGEGGHVHYVELDQFIGRQLLVTVHGPTNPAVPSWVPLRETRGVWERVSEGRFRPNTAIELSRAIVSAMSQEMEYSLEVLTGDVWKLEQAVTSGSIRDPERFLEEMFRVRHALLAVDNMSQGGGVVYGRLRRVIRAVDPEDREALADTSDQLSRVHELASGQRDYLQGIIDFYRTRLDTKMTIAAQRLSVIAAVTLPATALASVLGMNLIVSDSTETAVLFPIIVLMLVMTVMVLWWARKRDWW